MSKIKIILLAASVALSCSVSFAQVPVSNSLLSDAGKLQGAKVPKMTDADNGKVLVFDSATGAMKWQAGVGGAVSSVNGGTGDVTVTPASIGATAKSAFDAYTSVGRPTASSLGTAAYTASSAYATAAQGAKADAALQPGSAGRGSVTVCAWGTANTAACDYVCDGANDEVQIQAAVDTLPATGGVVALSEGYFGVGASVNLPKSNVEIVGKGQGTILYPTASGVKVFNVASGTTARTYAKQFRNLKLFTLSATSPTVVGNGSTVTVTTGTAHGFTTGDLIWMRGWSGGSGTWNGVYSVTVADATHFTYAANGNGTATGGKAGYAATAIYSYRSSQQKLIDVTISDFSRAIYAEEPWDHFQTRTQIMDCGAGDDHTSAAVVLRNGAVGGDKVAGYFIEDGRHETWMVGMGTQFLFDGSNAGGVPNDNIRISNSKFEYYISSPVIKGINTQHVQLNGNNFNGCTSNVIDIDSVSGQWNIGGPTNFVCGDATGRNQPIVSQIKFAGSVLNVSGATFRANGASQSSFEVSGSYLNATGNSFLNNSGDPARFHFTTASANNRVFANHASWASGNVAWAIDDGGTSNIVWGNGNGENVTEFLFNFGDVTTANVSTTKHGLAPKLPNDSTKFLNGVGSYTVPPSYTLPTASTTTLGGVKVDGSSITIANGVISAPNTGAGSVTSVGLSLPTEFIVTGSPVTSAGSLAGAWADQTTGKAFMSPNGSTGAPSFRSIVAADFGATMQPQFGALAVNTAIDTAKGKINAWGSTGTGVYGGTSTGTGVSGVSTVGTAVLGNETSTGTGVKGQSVGGTGVSGSDSSAGIGVNGSTTTGIAFNANGNYGTALKAYQFKSSMAQNNDNPVAYIQKNMTLNGFTSVGPVLLVENAVSTASASYGPLIQAKKGSTVVFQINEDGTATHSSNVSAKTFTPTNPAATTYGATTTFDLSAGDSPSVTLTGNPTLAFSNPQVGAWYNLQLKQDATGSRTATWPSTGLVCTFIKQDGTTSATGPTLATASGSIDTIVIHVKSSTTADCWARGY